MEIKVQAGLWIQIQVFGLDSDLSLFQNQDPDTSKMRNTCRTGSVSLVYTIVDSLFLFRPLVNGILLLVSIYVSQINDTI